MIGEYILHITIGGVTHENGQAIDSSPRATKSETRRITEARHDGERVHSASHRAGIHAGSCEERTVIHGTSRTERPRANGEATRNRTTRLVCTPVSPREGRTLRLVPHENASPQFLRQGQERAAGRTIFPRTVPTPRVGESPILAQ